MAKRFGKKLIPESEAKLVEKIPEIPSYLVMFFQAFKDLDRQRSIGFAPSYIPYLDIVAYARVYGFDEELEEELIYYIKGLDDHYLKMVNDENQRKAEKAKNSNK